MNLCIYEAMDRIPLGVAVTFEFIGPLGVAVVALARGRSTCCGSRSPRLGIVGLADYSGGSLDPRRASPSRSPPARCGRPTSCSRQRTGALFPGGSGLAIAMVAGAVLVAPFGIADARRASCSSPSCSAPCSPSRSPPRCCPTRSSSRRSGSLPKRVFGVLMSLEPAVAALAGLRRARPGPRRCATGSRSGWCVIASAGASTLDPVTHRGLIALSGREVNRVLEAVDADRPRADPLELAVHPRLRALARRAGSARSTASPTTSTSSPA